MLASQIIKTRKCYKDIKLDSKIRKNSNGGDQHEIRSHSVPIVDKQHNNSDTGIGRNSHTTTRHQ